MSSTLMKMMNRQVPRAIKKTCRLSLTQLLMDRSPQVVKAISKICTIQQMSCVISRHQVILTGGCWYPVDRVPPHTEFKSRHGVGRVAT
jgi:hypothetical protein